MGANYQRMRKRLAKRSFSYNPNKEKNDPRIKENYKFHYPYYKPFAKEEIIKMRRDIGKYINLKDTTVLYVYDWLSKKYYEYDDSKFNLDSDTKQFLSTVYCESIHCGQIYYNHIKIDNFVIGCGNYFVNDHVNHISNPFDNKDNKKQKSTIIHNRSRNKDREYKEYNNQYE